MAFENIIDISCMMNNSKLKKMCSDSSAWSFLSNMNKSILIVILTLFVTNIVYFCDKNMVGEM